MEIEGRECKEVKVGEHSYWFIEKYKGLELRKIKSIIGISSIDEKIIFERLPELFMVLCKRIDESMKPTQDYIDNLDMEESNELQDAIIGELTVFFTALQPKRN